jgi:tetratricopeptide (TPR) repeat protein
MESAERDIAHALEIAPHFGVAEVMRAAIDLQKGKFAVAGQRFQEAMTDDPGLGAAYLGMSVVLIHEQEFQAALSLLDRAEGLLPSVWMIHFEKAWTELGIGDSQAALFQAHIADRFVGEDDERKSGMSYLRAMIAIHQKNEDAARDYLAEAIARRPGGNYATLALKARQELQPLLASGR